MSSYTLHASTQTPACLTSALPQTPHRGSRFFRAAIEPSPLHQIGSRALRSATILLRSMLYAATFLALLLLPRAAVAAPSPEELGLTSHTVRLATGINMHYVEKGRGDVVLFLHSYTDSWRSFELNLPLVANDLHVFALDLRGHGDTSKPPCCYSQADFAADVVAFMDALAISKATLVGHGMGSFIAHKVAIDAPTRIAGLVLIGGAATAAGNEALLALNTAMQYLKDPVEPAFVHGFQTGLFWPDNNVPQSFIDTAIAESLKVPAGVWQQSLRGLLHEDHMEQLGKITTPTLILWGDQDSIFFYGDQQRLTASLLQPIQTFYVAESFPERAGLGSTGHKLHVEWPRRFVNDLEGFIRDKQDQDETPDDGQGTCTSPGCRQCQSAGFTLAHDQCVHQVVGARYSYKVRYRYTGANEGHDGAGNLLMWKGNGVNDICNISKGDCCDNDSGCPLGISLCSGCSSARVCRATQSCVGQFGLDGPMIDSGAFVYLGSAQQLLNHHGAAPYDCDCTSGTAGQGGGFEVFVTSSGTIDTVSLWGPSAPNTDAGTIETQGWAYAVQTYRAYTCGSFHGTGCSGLGQRAGHVNLDYRTEAGGNPDYTMANGCVPPSPSLCPAGMYCCHVSGSGFCLQCVDDLSACNSPVPVCPDGQDCCSIAADGSCAECPTNHGCQ